MSEGITILVAIVVIGCIFGGIAYAYNYYDNKSNNRVRQRVVETTADNFELVTEVIYQGEIRKTDRIDMNYNDGNFDDVAKTMKHHAEIYLGRLLKYGEI